jgi:hypothetical protein
MLDEVSTEFGANEREFWSSALSIAKVWDIHEIGYRVRGESYIPRRYCYAQAQFSDGVSRRVVFNIVAASSFISLTPSVVWCVDGLDRNHAYGRDCRRLGP